ncbi:MAG: flagellar hook-basal body complex protein [Ruminiclostridium sp.]|nr:flagellar hook-basal body complex protein [Ruminiclostridium sp.]
MIRGLYTSGWSMLAIEKKMDIITNNMANVNTNAYKKDMIVFESFPDVLAKRINDTRSRLNPGGIVGGMQLGSDIGEVFTYYNQGQLLKTDGKLDMAIRDSDTAFFTVSGKDRDGNEKEYYTRDGAFATGADNLLVTKEGYIVQGINGPIRLNGDSFSIKPDGTIIQDGEIADRLLIKEFTDTGTLRKSGSNLLVKTDQTEEAAFGGTVQQGYLELSNVNIVKEMVDMITVTRAYEANQKVLQAQDGTLEKAVNEVGAVIR